MNILIHMGDSYPDEGPAAKRMRSFSDVLAEKGHRVTVLAPRADTGDTAVPGVLYCPSIKMRKKTSLMRMLNQLSLAVSSFFVAFKAGKADVVITTSPPPLISISGWLIAKCKGAKLAYDIRDIWPDVAWEMGSFTPESLYSRVFAFIRNFMLKHADLVTAVSPGKVQKLQGYEPAAKVVWITNGLDEAFLKNQQMAEVVEKYQLQTGFNCVYIGNLGWAQGLMQLMQLAQRAKDENMDVRFLLFGRGVEEESLRRHAQEHDLSNVVFAGRLPNTQIYTVLKNAQMSFVSLVNANLKDSVPTKMFEALGVGCPVLLSAVGDAQQILDECGLGEAVSPNDSDSLWKAFQSMYKNLPDYVEKRQQAQNVILEKYSRQRAAELLEKELNDLIKIKNVEEVNASG